MIKKPRPPKLSDYPKGSAPKRKQVKKPAPEEKMNGIMKPFLEGQVVVFQTPAQAKGARKLACRDKFIPESVLALASDEELEKIMSKHYISFETEEGMILFRKNDIMNLPCVCLIHDPQPNSHNRGF